MSQFADEFIRARKSLSIANIDSGTQAILCVLHNARRGCFEVQTAWSGIRDLVSYSHPDVLSGLGATPKDFQSCSRHNNGGDFSSAVSVCGCTVRKQVIQRWLWSHQITAQWQERALQRRIGGIQPAGIYLKYTAPPNSGDTMLQSRI